MEDALSRALGKAVGVLPRSSRAWLFDCCAGLPGRFGILVRRSIARSLTQIGDDFYIGRYCTIKNWEQLRVGDRVSIHEYCFVHALGGIEIGDDVSIAHGCSLVSFEHGFSSPTEPIREQPLALASIKLSSNIWLGCGVRILSGVELGERTVVAAGAVVTRSWKGSELLAGVPAESIRRLDPSGA